MLWQVLLLPDELPGKYSSYWELEVINGAGMYRYSYNPKHHQSFFDGSILVPIPARDSGKQSAQVSLQNAALIGPPTGKLAELSPGPPARGEGMTSSSTS